MTNGDKIRRMRDEELEGLIIDLILVNFHGPQWPVKICGTCPADRYCAERTKSWPGGRDKMFCFPCPDIIKKWLKEDAAEARK